MPPRPPDQTARCLPLPQPPGRFLPSCPCPGPLHSVSETLSRTGRQLARQGTWCRRLASRRAWWWPTPEGLSWDAAGTSGDVGRLQLGEEALYQTMKEPAGTHTPLGPSVGVCFQVLRRGFASSVGVGRGRAGRPGPLQACCGVRLTAAHLAVTCVRSGVSRRPGSFPSSPWGSGPHFGVRGHPRQKVDDKPLWPAASLSVRGCGHLQSKGPQNRTFPGSTAPGGSLEKPASGRTSRPARHCALLSLGAARL